MGEWRNNSTILDISTSWRLVVSFKPLPFYHLRKEPPYPLHRRLDGYQSRSGIYGEGEIAYLQAGMFGKKKGHFELGFAASHFIQCKIFCLFG
jgi:hypothetical protein